jgi:hypothetical protein
MRKPYQIEAQVAVKQFEAMARRGLPRPREMNDIAATLVANGQGLIEARKPSQSAEPTAMPTLPITIWRGRLAPPCRRTPGTEPYRQRVPRLRSGSCRIVAFHSRCGPKLRIS